MSDASLVSIVVRTQGRRPRLLAQALQSLAAQTHPALEVIVVEDGGALASPIVETANGGRPGVFRHVPVSKRGRSEAGNAGLAEARGALMGFLDEDDVLAPEHLALLTDALTRSGAPCAYARARPSFCEGLDADEAHEVASGEPVGDAPFSRTLLWLRNSIAIQAALFQRDLYEQRGGLDPALDALEDWDLWIRYSAEADFTAIPNVTSIYRLPASRDALTGREAAHEKARALVLAKHAQLKATHSFGEVSALPALVRSQTSLRQSVSKAGEELAAKLFGRKPPP
jgi:glycosyltransferase involved in cell wall biosynthesis